jgi:hypothetical protein
MLRISTKKLRTKAAGAPEVADIRRALVPRNKPQGIASDQFFYFFLRLRKGECRRVVQRVQSLYPGESPEQHARRLINAQCSLSLLGGAILHIPQLFPGVGALWKVAGLVGGGSMLTRLNLYLILEIALLFGEDIDDQARVPEMMAVVAASGLSFATPLVATALEWHPAAALPLSGLTATAASKLIGESALAFYKRKSRKAAAAAARLEEELAEPALAPAA